MAPEGNSQAYQAKENETPAEPRTEAVASTSSSNKVAENAGAPHWQTNCTGLSERLGALRRQDLWTDCEFDVGREPERVCAHRVLLSSASSVMATMFFGSMPETGVIRIKNIEPNIFCLLLDFIYTDNITVPSCEVACELYRAANFYNIRQLETACMTYIIANVCAENVMFVYEFANKFTHEELAQKCLKVMSDETSAVLRSDGLFSASIDTLAMLFQQPELTIKSEMELFIAAQRWTIEYLKDQEIIHGSEASEEAGDHKPLKYEQDVIPLIRSALKHVRFLTIDPDEFARHDMSSLLSEREILAISLNLLSENSYMPMPEGFSTSRETRDKETFILTTSVPNIQRNFQRRYLKFKNHDELPFSIVLDKDNEEPIINIRLDYPKMKFNKITYDATFNLKILSKMKGVDDITFSPVHHGLVIREDAEDDDEFYDESPPLRSQTQFTWDILKDPSKGYVQDGVVTFMLTISSKKVSII